MYFDFVQKSGGFGSFPHPHAPFVKSLYQVVEAQGFPLNIGGHPSHLETFGVSGCWQEDSESAKEYCDIRKPRSSKILILLSSLETVKLYGQQQNETIKITMFVHIQL